MSVIRIKKARQTPYVILDTTALNDNRLSFRAKGLHTYLMSKPDDWRVNAEHLSRQSPKEGREAVMSALRELREAGYVRQTRLRDAKGRVLGSDSTVYETPLLATQDAEHEASSETIGLTDSHRESENPEVGLSEPRVNRSRQNRDSGQPKSAKPHLLIIDCSKDGVVPSIKTTTPPSPSSGKGRRKKVPREHPTYHPDGFALFYATYPNKQAKQDAMNAWDELQLTLDLQRHIYDNITERTKRDPQWLKNHGAAIPYPATYLRNARWTDEWQPRYSTAEDELQL